MSESNKTPEQGKNKARRAILKTLVTGGSALTAAKVTPDQWIKPVVESVIIPSHAQTTGGGGANPNGNFAANGAVVDNFVPDNNQLLADQDISDELLEFFMPSAQASNCPSNGTCMLDFGATVQNSSMNICISGGDFGSSDDTTIPISGSQLQIMTPVTLGGEIGILSGQFNGSGWEVEVLNLRSFSNSAVNVTLNPDPMGGCR